MGGRRHWLRRLGSLLALACAGSVAASASLPPAAPWAADPEAQFLLDVQIRQLKLGDGVRAYQTPEGTCILFGDFVRTLDVPVSVDLLSKKATGWAFQEKNRIALDLASGEVRYRDKAEPATPAMVRETPDGWCVDSAALARWFGIGVKPFTSGSALLLTSETKLPVEMAMLRQQRAAQIKSSAVFDLGSLPQVRLPYRMWRTPALDFVVSAGATYRAHDGVKVDRHSSVLAAGEIATLSYDARLSTDARGRPNSLRLHAYRSDPEGGLLGPLHATHLGIGDVEGFDSRLSGSVQTGRGAVVTNRPLFAPAAFDRTRFEGDLPSGWEAELYRNGELLAFAKPSGNQRYSFEDVQLLYGENRISILLYGPQGQVRTREEFVNVGQENVPPGKTWYWAGVSQPGRELVTLEKPPDATGRVDQPRAQATASLEHGLDERTSVGALARMMLVDDEKVTFIEGTVRRSIGPALAEVGIARESSGGTAARAQVLAKFGDVNLSAEAVAANDFHLRGDGEKRTTRDVRMTVDAPIHVGRTVLPAHGSLRWTDNRDGGSNLEAAARLSANIERFNLATDIKYRRQSMHSGPSPPDELDLGLIGTGRVGDVRVRGGVGFGVAPSARFRTAELSAYWSATEHVDWEAAAVYEADLKRARGRISHIRRLNSMAVALTGEAATDGSVAVGLNLNFSLDAGRGLRLSREPLAASGAVRALVYRDLNDNGLRDSGEPLEKGALVTTGRRPTRVKTGTDGQVLLGGLNPFAALPVGIDETSLEDPMLVPKKALQVVVPRPGVPAQVEIGLVGGGAIEGALVRNGGLGLEGADIELVDSAGKVVASARSDFDGFFLFERVAYGEYRLRLSADSAKAVAATRDLHLRAVVGPDKTIVRLGAIHVTMEPRIASAE